MSFTQFLSRTSKREPSAAKPRATSNALRNNWEIDKVSALAILAAAAIFAPVAVAILNQAAQIFAH